MNLLKKIKNRYTSIPAPVKASFWFFAMSIFQKGIQFIVTPIYTRVLTTDEYGFYSVFTSWLGIITIFATLTLSGGCFNNAMLKYGDDKRRYISSMQGLGNVSTVIVFAILFMLKDVIFEHAGLNSPLLVGMLAVLLFNPAFSLWTSFQIFAYSYRLLVISTLAVSVATPAIGVTLALNMKSHRQYAVIIAYVLVNTAIGIIFYIINLIKGKALYNIEYWSFALKFNIPLIPHYLSNMVLGQADRIMINSYCGKSQAGIYSLSYSISMMLSIVMTALNSSYVPWTYRKMKDGNRAAIGKYSNYILLILGLYMIAGCLVAPELIMILGTEEYAEAKWIVAPVMVGSYFTMLYSLFANIEFYYEKNIAIMVASVIAAVANIVLNAIFIPIFGYIAAGYTTMVCYMLLAIMHYMSMKRTCKEKNIENPYNMKFIISFTLGLTVMSMLAMLLYNTVIVRYGIIAVMGIACFVKRKDILNILRTLKSKGE